MSRRARAALLAAVVAVAAVLGMRACLAARENERETRVRAPAGLEIQYVLTPRKIAELPGPLADTFDVAPGGDVVIGSARSLLVLTPTADRLEWRELAMAAPPSSLAIDDGTLLGVAGSYLGRIDDDGASESIPLPFEDMRVAPSAQAGRIYLFGGRGATRHRVYAFEESGRFDIIVELPSEIRAVADTPRAVFVATAREIFRIADGETKLLFRAPDDLDPLVSIAMTDDGGLLFFATRSRVYALHGLAAIAVLPDIGGPLRIRDGALHVWARERGLLLRLRQIENVLLEGVR